MLKNASVIVTFIITQFDREWKTDDIDSTLMLHF